MQMNERIWLGSLASLAAMTIASAPIAAQQSKKPNIVVMLADNLGYGELGIYGGGILRGAPTPRIDALANEGLRLLNFNVEAQCTPSRSALLTGGFAIRSATAELLSARTYDEAIWPSLRQTKSMWPTETGSDGMQG